MTNHYLGAVDEVSQATALVYQAAGLVEMMETQPDDPDYAAGYTQLEDALDKHRWAVIHLDRVMRRLT